VAYTDGIVVAVCTFKQTKALEQDHAIHHRIMPLTSWLPVPPGSDFPLENLPYGVFRSKGGAAVHIATAIGGHVVDLHLLHRAGLFSGPILRDSQVFYEETLNAFMSLGKPAWTEARARLTSLLVDGGDTALRSNADLVRVAVLNQESVDMLLPARIGDYTDFYSSMEHATNVGKMFRPNGDPLLPNWKWLPVGYHGRASSVVVSGTPIRRPWGQSKANDDPSPPAPPPSFSPCKLLDFELEMGFFVGPGSQLGDTIPMSRAWDHIFGAVLLNDWSARDIQRWEYVPLGPFLGKNFGTTISPWIVTMEALHQFRVPAPVQDPAPLPYLVDAHPDTAAFDIQLSVLIQPPGCEAVPVTHSNMKHMYWSPAQQLAHHSINGCNMSSGDLLGTGTISGPAQGSYGSMLEITWRGTQPLTLPNGQERKFINDGDVVMLRAHCEKEGVRFLL
jgi:fumarylacetoacetase